MIKFVIPILCVFLFASCEQILEKDIQKKKISLLVPADDIRSNIQSIGFLWEAMDGNNSYRLQIVQPDFEIPEALVLDTLISKNSFYQYLDLGKYEWRVRAENTAYQSEYSTRSLWVDSLNSSKERP